MTKPNPKPTPAKGGSKEVTKTAIAQAVEIAQERPSYLPAVTGGVQRGQENVTKDDLVIPRLEIAQDLSPAQKKSDPAYIKGCEPGMFYNNVTRELYGTDVLVIPCGYVKEWLLWKDRKKGGGFAGAYPSETDAKAAMAELEDAEDYEAIDTGQQFCLILITDDAGNFLRAEQIVVSMAKSKAKTSRKWNSLIRLSNGDSFSKVYRLTSFEDQNKQAQKYHNFNVGAAGYPPESLYRKAEEFYKQLGGGLIKASRDFEETDVVDTAEDTATRRNI